MFCKWLDLACGTGSSVGGKQSHLVSQALHCSLLKETLFFPIRLSPETQLWVCVVRGMPGIRSTCFLKPDMHFLWFYHLRQISQIVWDLFRYKVKWKSLIALCDISGCLFAKSAVTSWQCLWVAHLQNDFSCDHNQIKALDVVTFWDCSWLTKLTGRFTSKS